MFWSLVVSELPSLAVTVEEVAPAPSPTGVNVKNTRSGSSSSSVMVNVAGVTVWPVTVAPSTMVSSPSTKRSWVGLMLNVAELLVVLPAANEMVAVDEPL